MKEIYEMKGAGRSMRGISGDPGIARNTVHRNLKSPDSMRPKPRSRRASKLWPHTEYVDRRVPEGAGKLRGPAPGAQGLGYVGGYSILKSCVSPRRRRRQLGATVNLLLSSDSVPLSEKRICHPV